MFIMSNTNHYKRIKHNYETARSRPSQDTLTADFSRLFPFRNQSDTVACAGVRSVSRSVCELVGGGGGEGSICLSEAVLVRSHVFYLRGKCGGSICREEEEGGRGLSQNIRK